MNEEREEHFPLARVEFTKSSSKGSGRGYKISVGAGCDVDEALTAYNLAVLLQKKAEALLAPPDLSTQLEASLEKQSGRGRASIEALANRSTWPTILEREKSGLRAMEEAADNYAADKAEAESGP